mmetsp:Transcript_11423/g.46297  ORF Transcript_11423/g.46297 Transcript_11423/m.46297 type:complete len:89 (+) Transcript_11423:217-483(+)
MAARTERSPPPWAACFKPRSHPAWSSLRVFFTPSVLLVSVVGPVGFFAAAAGGHGQGGSRRMPAGVARYFQSAAARPPPYSSPPSFYV